MNTQDEIINSELKILQKCTKAKAHLLRPLSTTYLVIGTVNIYQFFNPLIPDHLRSGESLVDFYLLLPKDVFET
jgi:hypothetical protein